MRRAQAPVCDGLYATAAGGVVARLDDDGGELVWRQVLDAGQTSPPPGLGLPTVFGDWLFVSWSCCRIGGSRHIVVMPYLGSEPSQPGNRFAIAGERVMWTSGDDAVSFGPECRPSSTAPQLNCEPDWRTTLGEPHATPAAVRTRSVVYTKPIGSSGSGTLTVLDAATGVVGWRADLGSATGLSAPVVSRRTFVARTTDGRLVAFPAGGCGDPVCEPVWETAPGRRCDRGEMAAAGDVVYAITSSGDVAAYDLGGCGSATCEPLATLGAGGAARTLIVHAGRLIVGTADGHVVALGLPPHRH